MTKLWKKIKDWWNGFKIRKIYKKIETDLQQPITAEEVEILKSFQLAFGESGND